MKPLQKALKPYGDSYNDGKVQLSFTLPIKAGPMGREAARQLAEKMNLFDIDIVEMKDLSPDYTFFVLYAKTSASINLADIKVTEIQQEKMTFSEINDFIKENIARKIVVVGACTGSDAHTVGLDAIMNMKGFAGESGLERYPWFSTYNLGSQIPNEELIKKAAKVNADAILVSQVVTQRGIHMVNLTELVELLEAEDMREKFTLIVGGPRISHELALELGFDAGFGVGTLPPDVAAYIAKKVADKLRK